MRNCRQHTGYAMVGTMIFLLVAMIMWLSVTRQLGTHLRMEKNSQLLQLYNDTTLRALSWGLALMETGLPPSNPYACKMQVGRDELQMFVVEIRRTANLRYELTARLAVSGDELLPDAPSSFMSLPGQATDPNPLNGAIDISLTPLLSWTAGSAAESHDVYFGTSDPPILQGNQAETTFNPGELLPNTTYYWRIDEINAAGATVGVLWSFTTGSAPIPPPGQATNPYPADGATGVSRSIIVSWLAGSGAESHDVYFGTTNPPTFQGNQTGTTFDPGYLAQNRWYYWRIDEVNASGTTTGIVWSFRTGNSSTPPPGQATNPNPPNGATDVSLAPLLGWTAGSDADSHNVYFGTSSSPAFQGNQAETTFSPGTLLTDTTYYWRIDEVGAGGTTTGVLWSFTTGSSSLPPPGQATNPNPANGATNVSRSIIISWLAGSGADSHDVYFGTTNPPTFQGNQTGTTFDPGYLGRRVWYYWRIDEVNASGTTTGVVWSFRTGNN